MAEQANFSEDLRSENQRLRGENQELRKMLIFDELTGLYKTLGLGRQEILKRVRQAMENNQALITVAEALKTIAEENGLAMRSHAKGDEFALMVFDGDRGRLEKRLKNLQKNGDEGQTFQQLWELASLREREEHRRVNG